jgi:hypothetical protein
MVIPITQALARQPIVTATNRGLAAIRNALVAEYVQIVPDVINQHSYTPIMQDPGDELVYYVPIHPADDIGYNWEFGVRADAIADTTVRFTLFGAEVVDVLIPAGTATADGLITTIDPLPCLVETEASVSVEFTVGSCDIYQVFVGPRRNLAVGPNFELGRLDGTTAYYPDTEAYDDESPLTPARHDELLQFARQIYRHAFGQAIAWCRSKDVSTQRFVPPALLRLAVPPTPDGSPAMLVVRAPPTISVRSSLGTIAGDGMLAVPSGFSEQAPLWADVEVEGSGRYLSAYWEASFPPGPEARAAVAAEDGLIDELGAAIVDEFGGWIRG